jgi:hypothetical protein
MGNLLNNDFHRAAEVHKELFLPPTSMHSKSARLSDFPLEHVRLRHLIWTLPIFIITLSGYGFTLAYPSACERSGWIALPLFLQFMIAATANAICAIHQTLVMDLWHWNGHASMAASNLVRFLFAGLGVGLVQTMIEGLGTWSTFVTLGLIVMVLVPLPAAQWYWGLNWRAEREAKRSILERVSTV